MATVATQIVDTDGLLATANPASAGGDKVSPDSIIRIINGSASPVTMTMVTPQTVDGNLAVSDRQVTVAASTSQYVRASRIYRNASSGLIDLTWSATTSITFEVIA